MNFEDFMESVAEVHPEVARRKAIDDNIAKGMSPEIAHECECDQVDLRDARSKARLAATLARLTKSGGPKSPETDKGSTSIYAQDKEDTKKKNGKQ